MEISKEIQFIASFMNNHTAIYNEHKEYLLNRWKKSKQLPRKRKKAERKTIKLLWSINEYFTTI